MPSPQSDVAGPRCRLRMLADEIEEQDAVRDSGGGGGGGGDANFLEIPTVVYHGPRAPPTLVPLRLDMSMMGASGGGGGEAGGAAGEVASAAAGRVGTFTGFGVEVNLLQREPRAAKPSILSARGSVEIKLSDDLPPRRHRQLSLIHI